MCYADGGLDRVVVKGDEHPGVASVRNVHALRSEAKGRLSRRRHAVGQKTAAVPASHRPFRMLTIMSRIH